MLLNGTILIFLKKKQYDKYYANFWFAFWNTAVFYISIADKINQIQPDLVLITGNPIDHTEQINKLESFIKRIDHSIQKYAVPGNTEYWGGVDLEQLSTMFSKHNCELLINKNRTLAIRNRQVSIVGMDDFIGGTTDFQKAINGLEDPETTIVLSHCPEYRDHIVKEIGTFNIDVILSEHTHGGQITFFGIAPITTEGSGSYLKGWYTEKDPKLYVSKGIGTSKIPIRFGARAEMVEIDL